MRKNWQAPEIQALSNNQISQMCMMVFGDDDFRDLQNLTGGRSHQNHCLTLANNQQVVLRISDNKNNLQRQYAVAQKLWQKLPVPRFLSAPLEANGKKYFSFLEFKQGERLENLEQLPRADHAQLGYELGEYLALLHSQTFKQAGDFSPDLKIKQTYDTSPVGLAEFFETFLNLAVQHGYINTTKAKTFNKHFAKQIEILEQWQHPHCLIHADLNEDNILQKNGHISAILDWEFVMSGHPAMDFGKFTRTPYYNCPVFLENLCDSYYLTHKTLPANWDEIAKIVDLMSWAEFLSRPNLNPDIKTSAMNKLETLL